MNAKFSILCDVIFLVRLQGKFEIEHSWERKGRNTACALVLSLKIDQGNATRL